MPHPSSVAYDILHHGLFSHDEDDNSSKEDNWETEPDRDLFDALVMAACPLRTLFDRIGRWTKEAFGGYLDEHIDDDLGAYAIAIEKVLDDPDATWSKMDAHAKEFYRKMIHRLSLHSYQAAIHRTNQHPREKPQPVVPKRPATSSTNCSASLSLVDVTNTLRKTL